MILALCGTVEGRELLKKLPTKEFPLIATVTTPYGVKCLGDQPNVEIIEKKLEEVELLQLIETRGIKGIIDVSHPYAEKISQLAIKVSKKKGLQYFRYEREKAVDFHDPQVVPAEDFKQAARLAQGYGGKVFLTIGSNHIPEFVKTVGSKKLIVRVLPTSKVMKICEDYGLTPDNIIAIKGPFTKEMNQIMFSHKDISVVVTKDSGGAGGTEEKIQAAKAVGKSIIVVKRPKINYGEVYNDMDLLITSIKNKFNR